MRKVYLSTIIAIIAIIQILTWTGCSANIKVDNQQEELVIEKTKVKHLMPEVKHGLNRVTIDDTTTILIYRGVESCTMIQIK